MPTFSCENCQKSIRVPDAYAGKRVRCPGCQQAQRVPEPSLAEPSPMDSIAALEAGESAVGVRRLREILIGCGACQKTIRLSSRTMGKTTPCPSCKALLQVDKFDLTKAKGDMVDMSHLELETADMLLNDASSHGSTLGGSAIQLEGTGTGYALSDTSMGSSMGSSAGSAATDSQSQMRELRELNDLKHSGAISATEYKRRKSEIYSGRSLAIQAMSRSADGSGPAKATMGRYQESVIPGPIKKLIVVAVLAVGGFVLWTTVLQDMLQDGQEITGTVAGSDQPDPTAGLSEGDAATGPVQSLFVDVPDESEDVEDGDPATAGVTPPGDEAIASTVEDETTDPIAGDNDRIETPVAAEPVAIVQSAEPSPVDYGEAEPVIEEIVEIVVLDWPAGWPGQALDASRAIGKACEMVKQISMNGSSAMIGVAAGPAVADLDAPAYVAFRREMQGVMTTAAMVDGMSGQMDIREYSAAMNIGELECQRMLFTFRGVRDKQVTIITGVQDGQAVAYWFVGSRRVYSQFIKTVGLAVLGPKV